jgi:DNA invertase Pin-like site-specific DNA recombinase
MSKTIGYDAAEAVEHLIGYARVSTWDQTTEPQIAALEGAGCVKIFHETASGTKTDRPELAKALEYLRPGDTLVVWRLDRLGRSLQHLVSTVNDLHEQGIGFRSIHESIDTTTSAGKLIFHIFAALAEFERDLIVDRTKAGLAAAKARGSKPGRKPLLGASQIKTVHTMHASGNHTIREIAEAVGASRTTVYKALSGASA